MVRPPLRAPRVKKPPYRFRAW